MKNISKRKFTWILSWTSVLLKLLISISRCDGIQQDDENVGNMNNGNEERILSRQKRYLIFPEGSSIQLIYDQVITIIDYNLLFLTGETVALAWELPSKPHYDDDLSDIYENGTLPLIQPVIAPRDDNENITKNVIYVNNKEHSNNYDSYYNRNRDSYYFGDRTNTNTNHYANKNKNNHQYDRNYYYGKYNLFNNDNDFNQQQTSSKINYYFNNNNNNRKTTALTYDDYHPIYNNENDKLMKPNLYSTSSSSLKPQQQQQQQQQFKASLRKFDYPNNENRWRQGKQLWPERKKKHHIYPAFVKRNADNYRLNEVDKYFLNHHRNTRETLYKSIELYLKTKGKNGTECLLKALCETGQRKHQDEPGSFIAEILRAIFSLPIPIKKDNYYDRKLVHYDNAHSSTANCTKVYPLCKESLWSSYFII